MKPNLLAVLVLAAMLTGAAPAPAQNANLDKQLARALKLFPEADTDKDGKLSMEEALAYVQTHPELKELLGNRLTPGSGKPATPDTPATTASSTLPAGPRIFVCAHSFMIYTAAMLPPLAEAAGIGYGDAGKQMIGGSRVIQHWNLPDDKNKAKAALREGKVDVLTLSPHELLPDEGIDNFTKLGLEKNPKLRVLVQASWPPRDGNASGFKKELRDQATLDSLHKQRDAQHDTWLKALETQVHALNAAIGHEAVCIVPVNAAVFMLRDHIADGTAPGLTKQSDLFRDDLGHPTSPLAELVTYCHFAAIYQRSPVGLPVPALLKEMPRAAELNTLLQQIAWEAVSSYPMSGVAAAGPASGTIPAPTSPAPELSTRP